MFVLTLTLCAALNAKQCEKHEVGQYPTKARCEVVKAVHAKVLGTGPQQNYRLVCAPPKAQRV